MAWTGQPRSGPAADDRQWVFTVWGCVDLGHGWRPVRRWRGTVPL